MSSYEKIAEEERVEREKRKRRRRTTYNIDRNSGKIEYKEIEKEVVIIKKIGDSKRRKMMI